MTTVYNQHHAHFRRVAAFVVMREAEFIGTVALKYGRKNLYVYIQFDGDPMLCGLGAGNTAAAIAEAMQDAAKLALADGLGIEFWEAFRQRDWQRRLEEAGFAVFQAV
jgi:hypothetical protein